MASSVIQTKTGLGIDPFRPQPEQICLEDIAWSLSHQCRFTGHCNAFYSVAQHSLRMAREMEARGWGTTALYAALHDASEAYLHDVPSPVKRHPQMAFYRAAEIHLANCIYLKFGLAAPVPTAYERKLKHADLRMLATECRDLITPSASVQWQPLPDPYGLRIEPMAPLEVYPEFLRFLQERFA